MRRQGGSWRTWERENHGQNILYKFFSIKKENHCNTNLHWSIITNHFRLLPGVSTSLWILGSSPWSSWFVKRLDVCFSSKIRWEEKTQQTRHGCCRGSRWKGIWSGWDITIWVTEEETPGWWEDSERIQRVKVLVVQAWRPESSRSETTWRQTKRTTPVLLRGAWALPLLVYSEQGVSNEWQVGVVWADIQIHDVGSKVSKKTKSHMKRMLDKYMFSS